MKIQYFSPAGALRTTALVGLAALMACGPLRTGGDNRASVIFINETTDQATVYATSSGADAVRLGTVQGSRTDTLSVPASVTTRGGSITIYARLLARSYQPSSGPITLLSGDIIRVRLPMGAQVLSVTPGR